MELTKRELQILKAAIGDYLVSPIVIHPHDFREEVLSLNKRIVDEEAVAKYS